MERDGRTPAQAEPELELEVKLDRSLDLTDGALGYARRKAAEEAAAVSPQKDNEKIHLAPKATPSPSGASVQNWPGSCSAKYAWKLVGVPVQAAVAAVVVLV